MTGVILAGGKSSRMGRDKRSVILPGGLSMEQNCRRILSQSLCSDVVLSGSGGIEDIHPGRGPLAGIEAALHNTSSDLVFFLPCDMPFVTPAQVNLLLRSALREPHRPSIAMSPYMEPLFAVVPSTWKTLISNAIAMGHLKVGRLWIDCGFTPVRLPFGKLLIDVDYPEDIPA